MGLTNYEKVHIRLLPQFLHHEMCDRSHSTLAPCTGRISIRDHTA